MRPTPQDIQLMSKHCVLSFKPQRRLEWRGQDGQNETEQPDHSASLGDSITSSTRIRFSVHTSAMNERQTYGDAVAYSHRLDGAPTVSRSLPKSQIGITKISCGPEHIGMKAKIPAEDTFVVALHLTEVARHELWSNGRPVRSRKVTRPIR